MIEHLLHLSLAHHPGTVFLCLPVLRKGPQPPLRFPQPTPLPWLTYLPFCFFLVLYLNPYFLFS